MSQLEPGTRVFVRWSDGKTYKGTIRQFSQGKYGVTWDRVGNKSLVWIEPHRVSPRTSPQSSSQTRTIVGATTGIVLWVVFFVVLIWLPLLPQLLSGFLAGLIATNRSQGKKIGLYAALLPALCISGAAIVGTMMLDAAINGLLKPIPIIGWCMSFSNPFSGWIFFGAIAYAAYAVSVGALGGYVGGLVKEK